MGLSHKRTVKIENLICTTNGDPWLARHLKKSTKVKKHPNYLALHNKFDDIQAWMASLGLDWMERYNELMALCQDLKVNGQKVPIKVYDDNRINSGHKRAACMLFLGHDSIEAEIVPKDTKL